MNTTSTTLTGKTRALPRVWARFNKLNRGDTFFVGLNVHAKRSFCTYGTASGWAFIAPWKRVRTTVFVRDVLAGGKSEAPQNPMNKTIPFPGATTFSRGSVSECARSEEPCPAA